MQDPNERITDKVAVSAMFGGIDFEKVLIVVRLLTKLDVLFPFPTWTDRNSVVEWLKRIGIGDPILTVVLETIDLLAQSKPLVGAASHSEIQAFKEEAEDVGLSPFLIQLLLSFGVPLAKELLARIIERIKNR